MKQNAYALFFLLMLTIGNIFVNKAQTTEKEYTGPLEILNDMAPKINENTDLYTGRCHVKIPLYTYQDKDFTIPIFLQYTSTGFKINEPIGHTGLGWYLNYGGSITRTINGVADELAVGYYGNRGYWAFHTKNNVVNNDNTLMNNGCIFSDIDPFAPSMYCWEDNIETTPDVFHFNFGNHKGSFCLGPNNSIRAFNTNHPYGEYKIEITRTTSSNTFYRYSKLAFKITTGDGYSYIFDARNGEDSSLGNYAGLRYSPARVDFYLSSKMPYTEWHLVEIKAPNGRKVTFEYGEQEENESSRPSYGSQVTWDHDGVGFNNFNQATGVYEGFENRITSVFPIKKITIDNTSIVFNYEERLKELLLKRGKLNPSAPVISFLSEALTISRLKSIQVNEGSTSSILKTCLFSYSYSNINPTGLDTSNYGRPVLFLKNIEISGEGSYQMDYYNESNLYPLMGQGSDHWGYYCDNMATDAPREIVDNYYRESHYNEYNFYKAVSGMLKKITYPTGGYTKYDYEEHTIESRVTKDLTNNNNPYLAEGGIAGGVRIKQITDFANSNDSTYRVFHYGYEGDPRAYSGILLHFPRYYRQVNAEYTIIKNVNCRSSSFIPSEQEFLSPYANYTHTQDQTHVGYSEVAENFPDGSYIIYTYSDYRLLPDLEYNRSLIKKIYEIQSSTPAFSDNFYAQYDSRHTQRGKLISKQYFSKQNNFVYAELVYSEEYKYDYSKALKYIPTAKLAYSYFYLSKLFVDDYPLTQIIKTTYPQNSNQNPIVETTSFVYNDLGQVIDKTVTNSDGKTHKTEYKYPPDRTTAPYTTMTSKNILAPVVEESEYVNNVFLQKKQTDYKDWGNNIYAPEFVKLQTQTQSNPETRITYHNYDPYGNPLYITKNDAEDVVYLWSYKGQYPVAKITGANFTSVNQALNINTTTLSNMNTPDTYTVNTLNNLRNILPSANITTYTYKPLVGMLSETDPSGKTIYYEYDSWSRLKHVKDHTDNILESYDYHYQNQ